LAFSNVEKERALRIRKRGGIEMKIINSFAVEINSLRTFITLLNEEVNRGNMHRREVYPAGLTEAEAREKGIPRYRIIYRRGRVEIRIGAETYNGAEDRPGVLVVKEKAIDVALRAIQIDVYRKRDFKEVIDSVKKVNGICESYEEKLIEKFAVSAAATTVASEEISKDLSTIYNSLRAMKEELEKISSLIEERKYWEGIKKAIERNDIAKSIEGKEEE